MSESIRFDGSLRFASPELARKHFEAIPEYDEELAFGREQFRQRGDWLDVRSSGDMPLSSWEPSEALIKKLARTAVEGSVDASFALEDHPIRLLAGGRTETLSHSERLDPRFNADWYARHPAEARAAEEAAFRPQQVPTQLEPHALALLLEDCLGTAGRGSRVFVRRIGIFRLEWMNVYYFDKWSEGPKGWFVFGKPTKELTQAFDVAGSRPLLENPKPDELDFEKWLGTVSGHGESWARKTVEGLSAWVEQQLRLMAECQLPGFCTFALSEYPGYTSRNPKSGEKVPAKVRPKLTLTMSPELAQRLGAGTARENSKPPVT